MEKLTIDERIVIETALGDFLENVRTKQRWYTEKQNNCKNEQDYEELEALLAYCEKRISRVMSALDKVKV